MLVRKKQASGRDCHPMLCTDHYCTKYRPQNHAAFHRIMLKSLLAPLPWSWISIAEFCRMTVQAETERVSECGRKRWVTGWFGMTLDHQVHFACMCWTLIGLSKVTWHMPPVWSAVQCACVHSGLQGEACTTAVHWSSDRQASIKYESCVDSYILACIVLGMCYDTLEEDTHHNLERLHFSI